MPDYQVVSERFPYLPIRLLVAGRSVDSEALLDTGFDGAVVIPADLLDPGLRPNSFARWTLADGSEVVAPVYIGVLRIGEFEPVRIVVTVLGHEVLLGRAVSDRFRITLEYGTRIVVEP